MKKTHIKQQYKEKLPPLENQVPSSKNALRDGLKRPFKGAADWQCSHYYFWWEYLRRHNGYRECCERCGIGKYKKLYDDFGDIHADEFTVWWEKKKSLFVSAPMSVYSTPDPDYAHKPKSQQKYYMEIPFNKKTFSFLKKFIDFRHELSFIKIKMDSEPKYGIETKVPLRSLWEHLKVWDAIKLNPKMHDADIADLAGIAVSDRVNGETVSKLKVLNLPYGDVEKTIRRRKQLAVQRHLRIAEQYIKNVALGRFPLRDGR